MTDFRDALAALPATPAAADPPATPGAADPPAAAAEAEPVFDMPHIGAGVDARLGWLALRLAKDYDLQLFQSAGFVGDPGFESGGFKSLQEIGVSSFERGGYGWPQWTGPRRRAYEKWCALNGLDPADDEANFGYIEVELDGEDPAFDYRYVVDQLRETTTIGDAVFLVGRLYEGPAGTTKTYLPGYDGRLAYAKRALAAAVGLPRDPTPATPPIAAAAEPDPEVAVTAELNRSGGVPPVAAVPPGTWPPGTTAVVMGDKAVVTAPPADPAPLPPARTAPGVAVAAGGGYVAMFAGTIQYVGPWNWPLAAPTDMQALNLAGFLVASGAFLFHLWANRPARAPATPKGTANDNPMPAPGAISSAGNFDLARARGLFGRRAA